MKKRKDLEGPAQKQTAPNLHEHVRQKPSEQQPKGRQGVFNKLSLKLKTQPGYKHRAEGKIPVQ